MPDSRTGVREPSGPVPFNQAMEEAALAVRRRLQEERRREPKSSEDLATERSDAEFRARLQLRRMGVPERYTEATWDEVTVVEAREWQANVLLEQRLRRGKGLMLFGTPGTGKSSLAALVCRESLYLDRSVRWEYVPTMLDEMEKGHRLEVETRQIRAGLLVWDDFGVDQLAPWHVGLLDRIVEHRYRSKRPMIVTSNLDPAILGQDQALGRIVDRWRQMCSLLVMGGKSRRRPE